MAESSLKVRDALETIRTMAHVLVTSVFGEKSYQLLDKIERIAKAALAEPRLNSEVGTADEQFKRYEAYCKEHAGENFLKDAQCATCPLRNEHACYFAWALLPYNVGKEDEPNEGE